MMRLTAVLLSLLTTACASLTVDVDAYREPVQGQLPESIGSTLNAVESLSIFDSKSHSPEISSALAAVERSVKEQLKAALPDNQDLVNQIWSGGGDMTGIEPLVEAELQRLVIPAEGVEGTAEALRDAFKESPQNYSNIRAKYEYLIFALDQYLRVANTVSQRIEEALEVSVANLGAAQAKEIVETSTQTLNAAVRRIAGPADIEGRAVGYPIFDPEFPRLDRDKTQWVDFLDASFGANGGNSQFVVLREGLLVFRQKSLDFDPTPVIGAGTEMTKLGLKVSAALATGGGSISALFPAPGETASFSLNPLYNEAEMDANRRLIVERRLARGDILQALAEISQAIQGLDDANLTPGQLQVLQSELERKIGYYLALAGGDS